MSVKVYRVEEKDTGDGPYTVSFSWQTREHCYPDHPPPQEEPKILRWMEKRGFSDMWGCIDYHCGFESIEKLRQWFSLAELENLQERDFVIRAYYAPLDLIVIGDKQVIFNKGESVEVDELEIEQFL